MEKPEMDTNKEEEENSQPLPNFPLKWTPFHICNSSYAAGLPLQNSSISSKFEDSLFNFSSSKSPAAVDTVSVSPPNILLGKSDRRIKLTIRKSARTASTDSRKKPTITKEQKASEIRINSKMRDQEGKRSGQMAMNLRPRKPTTTTKGKTVVEERGKKKAPKQSKKNNNKAICPDLKISLSLKEISDDLFSLIEERRLRRISQKRPKNVQKTFDTLYPGMLLHTITPEKYNVPRDAQRSQRL